MDTFSRPSLKQYAIDTARSGSTPVSSSMVPGRWFSTPRILYTAFSVSRTAMSNPLGLPKVLFAACRHSVLPVVVRVE